VKADGYGTRRYKLYMYRVNIFMYTLHFTCVSQKVLGVRWHQRFEVEINLRPATVGQSALVSGSHLDPMTRLLFSDYFGFLNVGHPL
jgi:hypothetical protein